MKQSLVVLGAGDGEEGLGRVIAENERLRSELKKVQKSMGVGFMSSSWLVLIL